MDQLRHQLIRGALLILTLPLIGCGGERGAVRAEARIVIDSAIPRDEQLRRFRAGVDSPAQLSGGARSRVELVREFMRALGRADTADLTGLVITRGEFAFLYYPSNPQGLPPYNLDPGLMWFMLQEGSRRGLLQAIAERGGKAIEYRGVTCDPAPSRQGENLVWGPCLVSWRPPGGQMIAERLFGLILERHGRFKFVSLANRL